MVENGSPAWTKGLPAGAIIDQIGSSKSPYFDDLKYEVSFSAADEYLICVWHMPGDSTPHEVYIKPRREKDDANPVIGLAPIHETKLFPKSLSKAMPAPVAAFWPSRKL